MSETLLPATTEPMPRGRLNRILSFVALPSVLLWPTSLSRWLLWLGIVCLGLYVLQAIVLVAIQDRLAFPGWAFRSDWTEPAAELGIVEIDLPTSDGNTIRAWWLAPPDWKPQQGAVLYAYGNGQILSDCTAHMRRWRDELKTAVLGFDLPGYGRSSGRPNEESCYAAAQAAHDWLTGQQKVAPGDIILVGESMGGAMVTELASRQDSRMLILMGAYTSFPDVAQKQIFWLPTRWFANFQFDNERKLRTLNTPVFVAHGTLDSVVPYSHGERNYEAAPEPKRFLSLANHPHMHPTRPAFYDAVRDFLAQTRHD